MSLDAAIVSIEHVRCNLHQQHQISSFGKTIRLAEILIVASDLAGRRITAIPHMTAIEAWDLIEELRTQ